MEEIKVGIQEEVPFELIFDGSIEGRGDPGRISLSAFWPRPPSSHLGPSEQVP